jgi:type I restriction enzyme R subunit
MTGGLSDLDRDNLGKTAAKMAVLVKTPERIRRVCEDIVQHFTTKVEPNGFKGQIVTFDRESCLLYKNRTRQAVAARGFGSRDDGQCQRAAVQGLSHSRDEEERLLDRFRDPTIP